MRSEFDFIQNIKNKYGLGKVGDDCAVLPKDEKTDMVVTADMLLEEIDFRLDWTTPQMLGSRALLVSLSDIAAMGAVPKWALLSVGVPVDHWRGTFLDEFYKGVHLVASEFGIEIVGGDISRTPDKVVIDSIVIGDVPKGKAVLRSGAKAGDAIFVTGDLGGSAGGLALLMDCEGLNEKQESWKKSLLLKHLQPGAQVDRGIYLRKHNIATSMIDLSDGLSSDIAHICQMNSVGARIFAERLPINPNVWNLFGSLESKSSKSLELDIALNGGEDFELLFTVSPEKVLQLDAQAFTNIGEITANVGVIELVSGGERTILEPKGYRHF